VTANVIVQRPFYEDEPSSSLRGKLQYSVYYGQTFDCDGDCTHQRTALTESYYLRDLGDVVRFPKKIYMSDVIDQFTNIFEDSAASVHSVINYVLLIRRPLEKPKLRASRKPCTYSISI